MKTVFLDATPLRGSSGHRGIGRFIYDLLHGLHETRDEWQKKLVIRVVHDLDWRGCLVEDDPYRAAEMLYAARGSSSKVLVHRRRAVLDLSAAVLGADLLHLTETLGTPMSRRVTRVVTCHDLIPLRMPQQYLDGLQRMTQPSVDTRRYANAERIVAISKRTKRDLCEILGLAARRIDIVHNGIDMSQWQKRSDNERERLAALGVGDQPYVVYVGYWDERKDVPAMLRAVAEANIQLAWAGHFTERDLLKLRKYLAAEGVLPLLSRVKFLGFVSADDLATLYRYAHAHLFLSRLEGFGLSVVEALAAGCPVIVARDSGADEIGGDAVIAVAQGDSKAAARAIAALRDPNERARLREIGIARARQFDRATMARGYVNVWRSVLKRTAAVYPWETVEEERPLDRAPKATAAPAAATRSQSPDRPSE
jgi:glycosyltransferase involved in cell wall biosynthesis